MTDQTKPKLKTKLFVRDGWQDDEGKWYADCAFGCGEILTPKNASLDRYPVMGKDGGKYVLENLRLACRACNSANKNYKLLEPIKKAKKAKKARSRKKLLNLAFNNNPNDATQPPPQYTPSAKRKLKENYPACTGRDANGLLIANL